MRRCTLRLAISNEQNNPSFRITCFCDQSASDGIMSGRVLAIVRYHGCHFQVADGRPIRVSFFP